ncbi:MAG: hypothetical protein ACT4P6_17355 [Gemmatimonadaceae bacterium]
MDTLIARGITIVDPSDIEDFDHRAFRTLEAMQAGVDAIVQGALRDGP